MAYSATYPDGEVRHNDQSEFVQLMASRLPQFPSKIEDLDHPGSEEFLSLTALESGAYLCHGCCHKCPAPDCPIES